VLELAGQAKKGDVSDWIGDGWRCCGCRPAPVVRRAGHRRRCRRWRRRWRVGSLRRWWRPAACSRPVCAPYAAARRDQSPHPRVGPVASRYRISRPERSGGREQLAPGHGPREQGGGRPGAVPFLDVDEVAAALAKRAEKRAHRRGAIASASERAQARVTDGTEDSRRMSLLLLASLSAGDPAFQSRTRRARAATLAASWRYSLASAGSGPAPAARRKASRCSANSCTRRARSARSGVAAGGEGGQVSAPA
jgi:hypothetical protein